MPTPEILIVGAGPTGLVLALRLARQGIHFSIIDKKSGPGEASRAMVVHARTLEFYRQQGIADEMIAEGIIADHAHFRSGLKETARLSLRQLGAGLSPYPFALCYPQDDHERFLVKKLEALGIRVQWNVELKSFTQDENGVRAVLGTQGGEEILNVAYVCGCDGAHSRVRETLALGFAGGTYQQLFYVADVKLENDASRSLNLNLSPHMLTLKLPVRSSGMHRLIGTMPLGTDPEAHHVFEDIRASVEQLVDVKVKEVNWFSTYHVHHRVASHFRRGRAFLAGDAGHIHSPTGGQGMNTGIGDAVNLSWKLANVLQRRARETLLDTYESERIAFARKLVNSTDRAFQLIVDPGWKGEFFRSIVFPYLAPIMLRMPFARRAIFRTVSQIGITYRTSAISRGSAGSIAAGDRLPWRQGESDNFEPLASMDWQLHVYGKIEADMQSLAEQIDLPVHVFPWDDPAKEAGFQTNSAFLIRPDGHIAVAQRKQDPHALRRYVDGWGLKFQK